MEAGFEAPKLPSRKQARWSMCRDAQDYQEAAYPKRYIHASAPDTTVAPSTNKQCSEEDGQNIRVTRTATATPDKRARHNHWDALRVFQRKLSN